MSAKNNEKMGGAFYKKLNGLAFVTVKPSITSILSRAS